MILTTELCPKVDRVGVSKMQKKRLNKTLSDQKDHTPAIFLRVCICLQGWNVGRCYPPRHQPRRRKKERKEKASRKADQRRRNVADGRRRITNAEREPLSRVVQFNDTDGERTQLAVEGKLAPARRTKASHETITKGGQHAANFTGGSATLSPRGNMRSTARDS